jgi:hypothetical protein
MMRAGHVADNLLSYKIEHKNAWIYNSTSSIRLHGLHMGKFPFPSWINIPEFNVKKQKAVY